MTNDTIMKFTLSVWSRLRGRQKDSDCVEKIELNEKLNPRIFNRVTVYYTPSQFNSLLKTSETMTHLRNPAFDSGFLTPDSAFDW